MKKSNRDVANRGLRTVVYFLILAFFLFPILWIFATAFKTGEEFMHTPPIWIPRHPTLTAFAHAIGVGGLGALKNSLIISISATTLSLIVGSLAGYGLARYRAVAAVLETGIVEMRFRVFQKAQIRAGAEAHEGIIGEGEVYDKRSCR